MKTATRSLTASSQRRACLATTPRPFATGPTAPVWSTSSRETAGHLKTVRVVADPIQLTTDDDLAIVTARFRSDAESHPTPSITLHVVQPVTPDPHTSNGLVPPPAYRTPSNLTTAKSKGTRTASHAGSVAGSVARSPSARAPGADSMMAATTLCIPNAEKSKSRSVGGGARSVRSMRSTTSRRSKWGNDDAEPLGDVKRRQFDEVGTKRR